MGEIMGMLPDNVHYQAAITTIAHKYNLPGVFYIDLWPMSWGQVIVLDPDVAQYMTVTKNHPKHVVEVQSIDPLIGTGNVVTTDGARWKYLHKMLSPAFAVQHISKMRPAVGSISRLNVHFADGIERSLKSLWSSDPFSTAKPNLARSSTLRRCAYTLRSTS
jgi:cytochrome P450